jgi:hypothetical protein
MKIRVLAEETVYKEYFVEVPEEIIEYSKDRLSYSYRDNPIHNWIDENFSEFNFQEYDSDFDWYTWEKVEENE